MNLLLQVPNVIDKLNRLPVLPSKRSELLSNPVVQSSVYSALAILGLIDLCVVLPQVQASEIRLPEISSLRSETSPQYEASALQPAIAATAKPSTIHSSGSGNNPTWALTEFSDETLRWEAWDLENPTFAINPTLRLERSSTDATIAPESLLNIAQTPTTPPATPSPQPTSSAPPPQLSIAPNILVLRSLRKPVGNKVLDTGVSVAGIRTKDTSGNPFKRDFLTGDWGGFRDYLYKKGIDLYLVHFVDSYGNWAGGLEQKPINYSGITLVGLDFYTSRLGWYPNGQIHLTATEVEGISVARNQSGALNSLYFVDPVEYGPRLFELWYGQQWGKRKEYEVRVGKIFPFVRIAASQTAGIFTNTSFQYPNFYGVTDFDGNRIGQSFSFAAAPFGLQFSYNHSPEWFFIGQIQDGYNDLRGGTDNRTNLSTGLSADEGFEGIFEVVYRRNQRPKLTGLPGTFRLGMQFHTGRVENNYFNTDGQSRALFGGNRRSQHGNYGFYAMAEQMLWRESKDPQDRRQGLNGFVKAIYTPNQETNLVNLNVAGGFAYEGPIPGRDRDVWGIAASYTRISDGVRDFSRDLQSTTSGIVIPDGETVIEMVYGAEIAPWWVVIGSLQHIIHPGGSAATPNATAFGVSNRFSF